MTDSVAERQRWCPSCETTKALAEFTLRKQGPRKGQPVAHCRVCRSKTTQQDYQAAHERDPHRYRNYEWPSKIKRAYGIGPEDYYQMLEDQGGGCATCGSKSPGDRHYKKSGKMEFFCIDHCHTTGRVRGLLCINCNTAIGLIRDNPDTAVAISAYLRQGV